jgi:hypothetical protein
VEGLPGGIHAEYGAEAVAGKERDVESDNDFFR